MAHRVIVMRAWTRGAHISAHIRLQSSGRIGMAGQPFMFYHALPGQGVGRGRGRELHLADERAFATLLRDLESPVEHDVEAVAGLALGADCRTGRHLVKAQRAAELQPRLAAQRTEAAAARVE